MAGALDIPERDLEISFVRSAGPGGQNVNKVSSAAQLRFNLAGTRILDAASKARAAVLAGQRLSGDGWIQIIARTHRTQEGNRRDAMERLQALIAQARIAPKKRRPTRPTRGSQERRLEGKTLHKQHKRLRSRVRADD